MDKEYWTFYTSPLGRTMFLVPAGEDDEFHRVCNVPAGGKYVSEVEGDCIIYIDKSASAGTMQKVTDYVTAKQG